MQEPVIAHRICDRSSLCPVGGSTDVTAWRSCVEGEKRFRSFTRRFHHGGGTDF